MDTNRKLWNEGQQELRKALSGSGDSQSAVSLFLKQHAMVHADQVSQVGLFSFAGDVWNGLSDPQIRMIPRNGEHSIAWMIWHLARIEDITMNILLAGGDQLLFRDGWYDRLKVSACDTGNAMDVESIARLSQDVDVAALWEYRIAVGKRTREVVSQLPFEKLKEKVQPERLQKLLETGAVREQARGLLDYWGNLTLAGLLLMPPTRHNFIHLNEAQRVKRMVIRDGQA